MSNKNNKDKQDLSPGISKESFDKGATALPGQAPLNLVDYKYKPEELEEGIFPEKDIYKALDENEVGDATLMIKLFKGQRLYDQRANPNAAWYYWNDHYWREDEQKEIFLLVNKVVALYYEQRRKEEYRLDRLSLQKLSQEEQQRIEKDLKVKIKKLREREQLLLTLKRRSSILKLASMGVNSMGYVGDSWDQDPWLLGCKNGVINLRTGVRRDGQPDDYIKTVCPVKWDDSATCPRWEQFFLEIFEDDQEIVNFMQRLFGYAVTGLREEHIYPILWGPHGRNGKGTIFETLKMILGPMACRASTQMIMQGIQQKSTGPNAGLMKMRGARISWTSEAGKRDTIDTAVVKALSGGDTITARNPFDRKETEFKPSHTLFTLTNPLPKVDADDDAFWTRVILIPFNLSYVDKPDAGKPWERLKNPKLENELKKELPGILKWFVQGTLMWRKQGLNIPKKLTTAKSKYRDSEDIIQHFLQERCVVDFSEEVQEKITMTIKPKLLYQEYKEWCNGAGFKTLNQKNFHSTIQKKIGEPGVLHGYRYYKGIAFKDSSDEV